MRISNNSIFRNLLSDSNKNRERVAAFQNHLSSGKEIRRASDGAVEFTSSSLIRSNIRSDEQFQNNISSGLRQSRTVQQALDDILDRLIELKKDAVHGANDTLGDSDREGLADKVEGIKADIVSTANVRSADVYVFGGTQTLDKPFFDDIAEPGEIGDNSNNTRLTIQMTHDQAIDISVTGDELRNTPAGDLFGIIANVEQALRDNDSNAVRAELDNIDESITHVSGLTTEIAAKITQMEYTFEHFEGKSIDEEAEISRLTDTDYAYAQSQIIKMQVAYEAAMSAHARISQTSLLNYLQ